MRWERRGEVSKGNLGTTPGVCVRDNYRQRDRDYEYDHNHLDYSTVSCSETR